MQRPETRVKHFLRSNNKELMVPLCLTVAVFSFVLSTFSLAGECPDGATSDYTEKGVQCWLKN